MRRAADRRGIALYETMLTVVILTSTIVVFVPVLAVTMRASRAGEQTVIALHLAQEMLDEVRLRVWDKTTKYPALYTRRRSAIGFDSSQGETAVDKTGYDDIDDFNGWSESPPQDPMGNPLPQFAGYTRSVMVEYVKFQSGVGFVNSSTGTDYKHIVVCVQPPNKKFRPVCLEAIRCNR